MSYDPFAVKITQNLDGDRIRIKAEMPVHPFRLHMRPKPDSNILRIELPTLADMIDLPDLPSPGEVRRQLLADLRERAKEIGPGTKFDAIMLKTLQPCFEGSAAAIATAMISGNAAVQMYFDQVAGEIRTTLIPSIYREMSKRCICCGVLAHEVRHD